MTDRYYFYDQKLHFLKHKWCFKSFNFSRQGYITLYVLLCSLTDISYEFWFPVFCLRCSFYFLLYVSFKNFGEVCFSTEEERKGNNLLRSRNSLGKHSQSSRMCEAAYVIEVFFIRTIASEFHILPGLDFI